MRSPLLKGCAVGLEINAGNDDQLRQVDGQALWSLEILARGLHVEEAELQPTLDVITRSAVTTVHTASYGGLILMENGTLIPQATTGEPPHLLDLLQQQLGDGPCISAAETQHCTRLDDTSTDERWPTFAAEATRLGVGSMLCLPVWIHDRSLGALSLYSEQALAFDDAAERLATLFAALAALALADAQRADQLKRALANRDLIGQAKGILMERHRMTAEVAFRTLSQSSQAANQKLVSIAEHLVQTGELPN
jgi:GAF domain-containing protein